jgi:catechol 2,3-dioxygenase-like lactoylglutathione lyase family enzyme
MAVTRLARIGLISADAEKLAGFYVDGLGFTRLSGNGPGAAGRLCVRLAYGASLVDIIEMRAARPYPSDVPGWSLLFQHFAMVVDDMARATARLGHAHGWTPISSNGPQRLPPSSGGVTAFKFRDPDGHPLEFIEFPGMNTSDARIDHSAISVSDTKTSIAFYRSLGFSVGTQTLNAGPEQDRLDGLPQAKVEVTALHLDATAKPHLELLCYRGPFARDMRPADAGDVAATRLVFDVPGPKERDAIRAAHPERVLEEHDGPGGPLLMRDPDGHILQVETSAP